MIIGLFVATRGGASWLGEWALSDVLYAVGLALLIGIAAGWLTAVAIGRLRARRLLSPDLDGFFAPATALFIYGAAEALGSYGLLAVFAAGIAFRRHEFEHEINTQIHHGAEMAGRLLELAVLLLLGSMLTTDGLGVPSIAGWMLAPLIIMIVRPALVLAITGRGFLDIRGRLFLGFFGVRGVAALFYASTVAESGDLSHADTTKVVWTTIACVAVSIVVTKSAPPHSPDASSDEASSSGYCVSSIAQSGRVPVSGSLERRSRRVPRRATIQRSARVRVDSAFRGPRWRWRLLGARVGGRRRA